MKVRVIAEDTTEDNDKKDNNIEGGECRSKIEHGDLPMHLQCKFWLLGIRKICSFITS